MNQRHPQSRHTPHGGSEKTDTEKGTRARKRKRAQGGVSSLLRKTTVPYKGACSTQRQREEPRPRVTEGGRGAGEGDLGVGEGPGG